MRYEIFDGQECRRVFLFAVQPLGVQCPCSFVIGGEDDAAKSGRRADMAPFRCLLVSCCALVAAVPTAPTAADAERLQTEAEHNMRQADATIEQLQTDMKRMDTFSEEVRRNLDEEAKAKQDLSHALGYFHRQMQLSSDERDVSHGRVSRLESEVSSLQRKVHQLEAHVDTCQKDKVRRRSTPP